MTTYTYAQLEGLWEQAGGSTALAPIMAAIAMAESGGNSQAYNPSGASGLWQILGAVNPADQGNLFNPQVNAKEAVLKYNAQGLDAWETYTNGAYKQFLQSGIQGVQPVPAGVSPSGTSTPSPGSAPAAPAASYSTLGVGDVISAVTGPARDLATALDYVFGMFGRGQGWRLAFTIIAAGALYASYRFIAAGALT
jgi:Lysozyme like domain